MAIPLLGRKKEQASPQGKHARRLASGNGHVEPMETKEPEAPRLLTPEMQASWRRQEDADRKLAKEEGRGCGVCVDQVVRVCVFEGVIETYPCSHGQALPPKPDQAAAKS